MTAVLGGIGTFAAWVSVMVLHVDARYVGTGWMIVGLTGYVIYRRRQGLDLTSHYKIAHRERPAFFVELDYRSAVVPIFGTDVDASALRAAAKLVGEGAIVEAMYVLRVPNQLSLDAGLEEEERSGMSVLESAKVTRPQGRAQGADAADPHPQPRRRDRRGGAAQRRRDHLPRHRPCASVRARARPDGDATCSRTGRAGS